MAHIKRTPPECGFALFELVLAIALATVIGIWAASAWMRQVDDAVSEATGVWLLTVQKAMNQMLRRQSDFMAAMTADLANASNYVNLHAPTIAELITAGHLPNGFALRPPLDYSVSIRVLAPEGDCKKMGCRIEAFIFAQPQGMQRKQATDVNRIGHILSAMQGQGASVHPLRPDRVTGPNLDIVNPPAFMSDALPQASIVAKSFYDSSHLAHLVRREDRRDTMLAGQLHVKKGLATDDHVRSKGGMFAQGRITTGEYLQLQGRGVASQACEDDGLIARSAEGDLLTCQSGRWRNGGTRFGGIYALHNIHGCGRTQKGQGPDMSNPFTGDCSCPPSFSAVKISRWKEEGSEIDEFRSYICLR